MRSSVLEAPAARRPQDATAESWLLLGTTYAVIISGALLLAVAEKTLVYALTAVLFCVGHGLIVGPGGPAYVSKTVGKFLAVGALAFGLLQTQFSNVHVSYGLAHFLMLVQFIKLYGSHGARDLRLIQVATIFEVMVAGIWTLDLAYLPVFIVTCLSLMANFIAVATLPPIRVWLRAEQQAETGTQRWRDLWSALWLPALSVFACTVLLFLLLPRVRVLSERYRVLPEQVTGFSENVSLHDVGQLRQSEQVALRAEFLDETAPERPHLMLPQVRMRGVSLPVYESGQWFGYSAAQRRATRGRRPVPPPSGVDFVSRRVYSLQGTGVESRIIRQRVFLESKAMRTLFSLYRPVRVEAHEPYERVVRPLSHHLQYPRLLHPGEFYEVISLVPQFTPEQLRAAGTPGRGSRWPFFWEIPEGMRPVLERVAAEIEEAYQTDSDYERVIAAQSYLLDRGRFSYTLKLPEFGGKEPIEAFLTETRRGSCEQFSSALALILRIWDIPTRLVVGFKGGEYDPRTESYVFRDKHAHAWVEVYFNGLGWVEFDPTPGAEIVRGTTARPFAWLRELAERGRGAALRAYRRAYATWGIGVIGYNRNQQRRVLQGLSDAARGFSAQASGMFRALWPGMPDLGLVQVALLVVSFTFVGMGLYLSAHWLQSRFRSPRRPARLDRTLRFYQEMLRVLRKKGLTRPLHFTPREFARAAAARLSEANEDGHVLRRAVSTVTDSYYQVRFGGYELSEAQRRRVRAALRRLAQARRVSAAPR